MRTSWRGLGTRSGPRSRARGFVTGGCCGGGVGEEGRGRGQGGGQDEHRHSLHRGDHERDEPPQGGRVGPVDLDRDIEDLADPQGPQLGVLHALTITRAPPGRASQRGRTRHWSHALCSVRPSPERSHKGGRAVGSRGGGRAPGADLSRVPGARPELDRDPRPVPLVRRDAPVRGARLDRVPGLREGLGRGRRRPVKDEPGR